MQWVQRKVWKMDKSARIFVAGHRGMVGSALVRKLRMEGYEHVLTVPRDRVDLTDQKAVNEFFAAYQPEYVLLAAARVGGILANSTWPADFIRVNLLIQTNVIDAAYRFGTRKLLFLGSSCIYPKEARQPIREEYLLSGKLEPTNEAYAVSKIAGIAMCQAYRRQFGFSSICLMPTNLYGPGDNFDLFGSHVLAALIRKFHEAKEEGRDEVIVWGSGKPRREFMHVDDLTDACIFLMGCYDSEEVINVGVGKDISIRELADLIKEVVGFEGKVVFDSSKPDGVMRKCLDVSKLHSMGWRARIGLEQGVRETYRWFLEHRASGEVRGLLVDGGER